MVHSKVYRFSGIYFLSIFFCLVFNCSLMYGQAPAVLNKMSMGLGGGVDYGGLGVKINYELSENIDAFTSLGLNVFEGKSIVVGAEYVKSKNDIKRYKPFVSISIGRTYHESRRVNVENVNYFNANIESRNFIAANLSTGVLVNLKKNRNKAYLKFGVTSSFYNNRKVLAFVEELNETYGENFSRNKYFIENSPLVALRIKLSEFL